MFTIRKSDQLAVQLKQKLQLFPINKIAVASGFVKRKPIKIRPLEMLLAYFIICLTGGNSLSTLAAALGFLGGCCISKQAIDKRIKEPFIKFLESILAKALLNNVDLKYKKSLGSKFKRILVQDSTHIQLDSRLAEHFPGSVNQSNKKIAILKIQAVFDLLTEQFCQFATSPYTKNDQKASADILDFIRAGDLIIRDLGYFVLSVFKKIIQAGAFFLSRLRCDVLIYELNGNTRIDLLKLLTKRGQLDIDVLIGANEKLPVRLVAIPVSENVAAERRRKLKKDRRRNLSKKLLALLGWNIFILNVDRQTLTIEQIEKLYGCRWRIEIIFKSWKSHFNIRHVPLASVVRVLSYIYAMLIFITIFQTHIFVNMYNKINKNNSNQLSLLKLSKFCKDQIWAVMLFFNNPKIVEKQILYHCQYEKRKDRINYLQQITELG
jgi:hypothetical protein